VRRDVSEPLLKRAGRRDAWGKERRRAFSSALLRGFYYRQVRCDACTAHVPDAQVERAGGGPELLRGDGADHDCTGRAPRFAHCKTDLGWGLGLGVGVAVAGWGCGLGLLVGVGVRAGEQRKGRARDCVGEAKDSNTIPAPADHSSPGDAHQ